MCWHNDGRMGCVDWAGFLGDHSDSEDGRTVDIPDGVIQHRRSLAQQHVDDEVVDRLVMAAAILSAPSRRGT